MHKNKTIFKMNFKTTTNYLDMYPYEGHSPDLQIQVAAYIGIFWISNPQVHNIINTRIST